MFLLVPSRGGGGGGRRLVCRLIAFAASDPSSPQFCAPWGVFCGTLATPTPSFRHIDLFIKNIPEGGEDEDLEDLFDQKGWPLKKRLDGAAGSRICTKHPC